MPPPVAFAACEEYVFKRDFQAQKWVPVDADNKQCRVQFMRKDTSYFMRLLNSKGDRTDFPLSRESKLHFSPEGFLQIPLADVKELYAVKFQDKVDGEAFYAKIVNQMDLPWSAPKTTIGPDHFPNPAVHFGPAPQTLPPERMMQQKKVNDMNQPPVPHSLAQPQFSDPPRQMNSQGPPGHSGSGDSGMIPMNSQGPLGRTGPGDMGMRLMYSQGPPGRTAGPGDMGMRQGQYNDRNQQLQDPRDSYRNQGQGQYGNLPQQNQVGRQYQQSQFENQHPQNQFAGQTQPFVNHEYRNLPQQDYTNQLAQIPQKSQMPPNQYQSHFQHPPGNQYGGQNHQDSRFQNQNPYQGGNQNFVSQPQRNVGQSQHGNQYNPMGDYRRDNQGGYNQQQAPPRPPKLKPVVRPPDPLEDGQLGTLALSLMKAINDRDTENAQLILQRALKAKKSFMIECKEIESSPPPEPSFSLEVGIEFQQPQKKPLTIYLYNIRESSTIFDLQIIVEQKFHIPRLAQNWIIGPNLIKRDDRRPLKEHGLKFIQGMDSQKIYLYVQHTKKANVAKEDLEEVQSKQRALAKKQQQPVEEEPPLPPQQRNQPFLQGQQADYPPGQQANYPQGQQANYPPGQQANYHQRQQTPPWSPTQGQMAGPGQYPQGNQHLGPQHGNDPNPTYDKIGNRGYNPGFTNEGLAKFRVNQDPPPQRYLPGANEPLYESIKNQGGPIEPLDMRGPPLPGGRRPPPGGIPILPSGGKPPPGGINVMLPRGQSESNSQAVLGYPNQLAPVPAPAPAPPPPEPVGWKCTVCTFLNKPRRPGCEMCTSPRPDDFVVPDDTPLDTLQVDEKKNDELFQEYEKREKLQQQEEAARNYQALIQAEDAEVVTNKEEFDCLICYVPTPPGEGVILRECLHQFCKGCLHDSITNSQTAVVTCPFDDRTYQCGMAITEREMKAVLTNEELEAVHKRGLREAENASPNSFHCKTADCQGFCFYEDDVNEFHCPVCDKRNCLLCKAIHEGMDCKEYQDDLKRRAANDEAAKATQNMLEELVQSGDAMKCPQCHIIVQKKDGCDWIRCSMCRTEICWATKGPRWGPKGHGDTSGGCKCRVGGKKCTPLCRNCH